LRLLAVFLVICVLMLAVVAWELVQLSRTPRTRAAAGPATNVAVDLSSRPTVSGKQDSVATAVEPQPAAQSPVGSDQAESPLGGPPAASQAAVNWASQPELRHAQQRLAAAREALAVDRSNPVALRDALMALRALERWPEACRVLARLVEVEPEEVGLRFEYASTLMRLSRWVDAVHALQVVVEREPDHAQAWYNLGIAHQALGHLEDARRAWNRTIELMPDNPDAYAHRGRLPAGRRRAGTAPAPRAGAQPDGRAVLGVISGTAPHQPHPARPGDRILPPLTGDRPEPAGHQGPVESGTCGRGG
jgi:hypothetical protein